MPMNKRIRSAWHYAVTHLPDDALATPFLHAVDDAGQHRYSLAGVLCELYISAGGTTWVEDGTFNGHTLLGIINNSGGVSLARPTPEIIAWSGLSLHKLDAILSAETVDQIAAKALIKTA